MTTLKNYFSVLPQRFDIGANTTVVSLIQFISDMAVSDSPEAMESAIDKLALPTGSYAIKRASKFNFT
jgi:hypothetical protein